MGLSGGRQILFSSSIIPLELSYVIIPFCQDALLIHAYEEFKTAGKDGGPNWSAIAERLGNRRAASACRMRFLRSFAPKTLALSGWTPDLDQALIAAYVQFEHAGPGGRPCMKSIAAQVGNGLKAKQCMVRLRELLPCPPTGALSPHAGSQTASLMHDMPSMFPTAGPTFVAGPADSVGNMVPIDSSHGGAQAPLQQDASGVAQSSGRAQPWNPLPPPQGQELGFQVRQL